MDETDQYDEWDLSPLLMPPRSTLYALQPIEMGTPLVESLSSYVTRLAEAHCVFSGLLMSKVIVPLVPGYAPSERQHGLFRLSGERSTLLNGTGLPAKYGVQALKTLTGRTDLYCLTLLPLAAIFAAQARGLIRLTKAWCPVCYENWREHGQMVYDPLLWFFQAVAICPHHHCRLYTRCPYQDCAQSLPAVAWRSRAGYCSYCQRWLGLPEKEVKVVSSLEEQDWRWHQWVVQTVGEMLATLSTSSVFPNQQRISNVLTCVASQVTEGNITALARALGIVQSKVHAWCHGDRRPEITTLLHLCHDLGLSLSDFLYQEIERLQPHLNVPSEHLPQVPKRKNSIPVEQVYSALEQILASKPHPPISLGKVAQQLGWRYDILYKVHPVACHEIAAHYKTYLQQRQETRLQRFQAEIRQVALQLHADGISPTQKRIAPHLSQSGILRDPRLRTFLNEICRELGESA